MGNGQMRLAEIASTERRSRGIRAPAKAGMEGWVGPVMLTLLFLMGSAYLAFGGTIEASSPLAPKTSIAVVALEPASVGSTPRNEKVSGSPPEPTPYFPAGYTNRGRDGDGNIKTYEHD